MSQKKSDQKPQLHLIPGNKIDAESLAKLFQSLTGKPSTEQEMQEVMDELLVDGGKATKADLNGT